MTHIEKDNKDGNKRSSGKGLDISFYQYFCLN